MTGRLPSVALALALLSACGTQGRGAAPPLQTSPLVPEPFTAAEVRRILQLSPLPAVPPDPTNRVADDPRAARLGQFLFFDERLSRDANTSCATCHDPARSWTDGRVLAEGLAPLDRHTPSLWNVAHQRWFFWDGRADSLWAQALIPLESPLEHSSSRLQLAHLVHDDALLRAAYERVFGPLPDLGDGSRFPSVGRPVPEDDHAHELAREHAREATLSGGHTHGPDASFYHPHQRAWDSMRPEDQGGVTEVFVNLGKAIAAYERRILSRHAPFDRFVEGLRERDEGKLSALDAAARRGLELFVGRARCVTCHDGPTLSDKEFHDLGLPGPGGARPTDPGRRRGIEALRRSEFNGVGRWSDDPRGAARSKVELLASHAHGGFEFKTPSLRNVAVNAPYMHDGQLASLEDVVGFYSTLAGEREDPPTHETILRPLGLTETERQDLIAFLRSLTDEDLDPTLMRPPASPSR